MIFNSYAFMFFFVPVVLTVFISLKYFNSLFYTTIWLVLSSIFFYGYWKISYVALLLLSIFVNYLVGVYLSKKSGNLNYRKSALVFGIVFNLGLISYFKYYGFFIETIHDLTGISFAKVDIALPLAISFFTFQQIAFLVDTFRSREGEPSLLNYVLFVSFFPQLIAGPIVHYQEIIPQFHKCFLRPFLWSDLSVGLFIFTVGLVKKVVIADQLAIDVDGIFSGVSSGIDLTFFEAWLGALSYTFQIYFDFSGYSDMAIGLARLFGIRLPMNFMSPYKATSIIDFWKRWNMTLSRFLRDYLYIPLGGNRRGNIRRHLNIVITMLLGGLWHGASWTFVFWGGVHGVLLIVNHAWRALGATVAIGTPTKVLSWGVVFIFVVFAWTFFRSNDIAGAINLQRAMLLMNGVSLPGSLETVLGGIWPLSLDVFRFDGMFHNGLVSNHFKTTFLILTSFIICLVFPNTQNLAAHFHPTSDFNRYEAKESGFGIKIYWRPVTTWIIYTGTLLALGILSLSSAREFLYFQF